MAYRPERLAEAIKAEVSDLLFHEVKDPRIGFVTITAVEVTPDLRTAKIYASVYGSPEEQRAAIEALQKARGFLRGELGRRIRLRYTPEISFKFDPSIIRGARVMELLSEIKGGGENAKE